MAKTIRRNAFLGFTLIELLVVISIIALLVGILLPALGAARKTAQGVVCQTHMKNLTLGFAVYATENGEWWPSDAISPRPYDPDNFADAWIPNGDVLIDRNPNYDLTKGEIFDSVGDKKVWACPSDEFAHLSSGLSYSANHQLYRVRANDPIIRSQRGASQDEPGVGAVVPELSGANVIHPWSVRFRSPSQLIALVDEGGPDNDGVGDQFGFGVNDGFFQNLFSEQPGGNSNAGTTDKSKWYHNGAAAFGFADGHGELRKDGDLEVIGYADRRVLPNGRIMQYGKLWDPLAEAPLTPN